MPTKKSQLLHRWYSLGRPVTIGTPMVLSVFDDWFSVPFVKNSQKQSKDSQNSKITRCTNRHMSTQSPPNTQSRANAATLRNLHHMCLGSGDSPSPVGRADCMCLHGRPCVWLPFAAACGYTLLPTDDACSSSSLSTTVIKFFIFWTQLANVLLSRPNSVEYGNFKTTTLLAKPLAACRLTYLCSIVSELYDA